jgi:hypothetical protein
MLVSMVIYIITSTNGSYKQLTLTKGPNSSCIGAPEQYVAVLSSKAELRTAFRARVFISMRLL